MKIYIIRTQNCPIDLAERVVFLLNEIKGSGPLNFLIPKLNMVVADPIENSPHEVFFEIAKSARIKQIMSEDYIVLLTPSANADNWFSAFDRQNNIYINTSDWEQFQNQPIEYPIAYSIIENIIQSLMQFDIYNIEKEAKYIHKTSIGCINDFCGHKPDFILKLKAANICEKCQERIIEIGIAQNVLIQISNIIERIRNKYVNKNWLIETKKPTKIEVGPNKFYVTFDGANEKCKIDLSDAYIAFYLFLLKFRNGIEINKINRSREGNYFEKIYQALTGHEKEKVRVRVNNILTLDGFAQYRNRINKEFLNKVPTGLLIYFQIAMNENQNQIKLDRNMIKFLDLNLSKAWNSQIENENDHNYWFIFNQA